MIRWKITQQQFTMNGQGPDGAAKPFIFGAPAFLKFQAALFFVAWVLLSVDEDRRTFINTSLHLEATAVAYTTYSP